MSATGRELGRAGLIDWENRVVHAIEEGAHGRPFTFTFDAIEGLNGSHPRELKTFSTKGFGPGVEFWFERDPDDPRRVARVFPVRFRPHLSDVP